MPAYTDEEMASIHAFLLERHVPRDERLPGEPTPPPVQVAVPARVSVPVPPAAPAILASPSIGLTCRHCKSADVVGQHGRYGYYLKCNQCQGNTSMDQTCSNCKAKARIQKSGPKFSRVCEACGMQVVVHENLPTVN
jgi:hypothetical protein